jgi:hypothetical protein
MRAMTERQAVLLDRLMGPDGIRPVTGNPPPSDTPRLARIESGRRPERLNRSTQVGK